MNSTLGSVVPLAMFLLFSSSSSSRKQRTKDAERNEPIDTFVDFSLPPAGRRMNGIDDVHDGHLDHHQFIEMMMMLIEMRRMMMMMIASWP